MTPEWGTSCSQLPPETQFLLTEVSPGGPFALFLPLIDSNAFRCTLRPHARDDTLVVRPSSGDTAVRANRWCVSSLLPYEQLTLTA